MNRIGGIVGMMLILALALPAAAQEKKQPKQPAVPEGVTLQRDITYATVGDKALQLDLYMPDLPGQNKPPLVVWIHGGAWRQGSKDRCPIAYLAAEGFAVASIQYRLTGEAIFPAQAHDAKAAIRWLRANAARLGYDASNIAVAGGSAGGHLAALVGTSGDVKPLEGDVGGNLDQSSRVQAVIDFYGPTDLYYNATQDKDRVDVADGPLWQFLGGKPSERLDAAKLASPVHHVSGDDPPLLILHGTEDPQVRLLHSQFLHDAYQKAGLPVQLVVIEGAGHGGPMFNDDARRQIITTFLRRHLSPRG